MALYFVDGNHEWFPELHSYEVSADGMRRLRETVIHLPRGYRTKLASGRILAALGGANSIDRDYRREGSDWWADETISKGDLELLGTGLVDVLVGHDAPLGLPTLDSYLRENRRVFSAEMLDYSLAGRKIFHQGFVSVRPSIYIGGHYHYPVDEQIAVMGHDGPFSTRVVLLDESSRSNLSMAVLDTSSLGMKFLSASRSGANSQRSH